MSESCNVSSGGCCEGCGTECGGDPVECATAMWCAASKQAMLEVKVELLKDRIKSAWGEKMEKGADAAIEVLAANFSSMLSASQAKEKFKNTLSELFQE